MKIIFNYLKLDKTYNIFIIFKNYSNNLLIICLMICIFLIIYFYFILRCVVPLYILVGSSRNMKEMNKKGDGAPLDLGKEQIILLCNKYLVMIN